MSAVTVPSLDIDALMLSRFGLAVSDEGYLERRIVASLIAHIEAAGFGVTSVNDGEAVSLTTDAKAAMELIFDLNDAWVRFRKPGGRRHSVLLVVGNGRDIVSDWTYRPGDPEGFDAAIEAFIDSLGDLP